MSSCSAVVSGRRRPSSSKPSSYASSYGIRAIREVEPDPVDDPRGELEDRDRNRVADVERAAAGAVVVGQREDRADRVADVQEATRLAAVAVDGHVLAGDRLADKTRHDHSVGAPLSGADRVEQPDHDRIGAVLGVIAVRHRLAVGLRDRIGPAALGRRPEDPVGVLVQRAGRVLAVHLRGGGEQQPFPLSRGRRDDHVGAVHDPSQRLERLCDHQLDPDRRGQVQAHVAVAHQLRHQPGIGHRAVHESHRPGAHQGFHVGGRPVLKSSRITTASSRPTRASAICEPINPAPPVIRYLKSAPHLSGSTRRLARHRVDHPCEWWCARLVILWRGHRNRHWAPLQRNWIFAEMAFDQSELPTSGGRRVPNRSPQRT